MGWPGPRRRTVPLKLSEEEERPVREIADAEHAGNLSAAIRALLAETVQLRARVAALEGEMDEIERIRTGRC